MGFVKTQSLLTVTNHFEEKIEIDRIVKAFPNKRDITSNEFWASQVFRRNFNNVKGLERVLTKVEEANFKNNAVSGISILHSIFFLTFLVKTFCF